MSKNTFTACLDGSSWFELAWQFLNWASSFSFPDSLLSISQEFILSNLSFHKHKHGSNVCGQTNLLSGVFNWVIRKMADPQGDLALFLRRCGNFWMLTRSSNYLFTSLNRRSDVIAPRGENQGFFPGSRKGGAAVVANQAQRWLRDGGRLTDTSVTRAVKLSEKLAPRRKLSGFCFFYFLLLTSAVKIRWRENGGHASDNGFIIQSHTLFKQPLHSADSKRQQGIDSGRLIIKKINEYEWKRWADVGR